MGVRAYKPYTASTRQTVVSDFVEITKSEPEKSLTTHVHRKRGRNNRGVITSRRRGGGHKRLYRIIDFKRNKRDIIAEVIAIEYDPTAPHGLRFYNTKMVKSVTLLRLKDSP